MALFLYSLWDGRLGHLAFEFQCMNARTKTLFHLTKSLDVLMRILEEGFWPQYCLEDITWLESPSRIIQNGFSDGLLL
jgi:hypothetical protein